MVRNVPTVNNVDQSLEDICKQQLSAKRGARKNNAPRRGSAQVQRAARRRSIGKSRGSISVADNGAQKNQLVFKEPKRTKSTRQRTNKNDGQQLGPTS